MAQDHMLDQHGERRRKSRDRFDFLARHSRANGDVAQQASRIGIINSARVAKLVDFSDIVQHHAGEQQVRIELGIMLRDSGRETHQAHDVLQQAAEIRVVHGHGRGRAF